MDSAIFLHVVRVLNGLYIEIWMDACVQYRAVSEIRKVVNENLLSRETTVMGFMQISGY